MGSARVSRGKAPAGLCRALSAPATRMRLGPGSVLMLFTKAKLFILLESLEGDLGSQKKTMGWDQVSVAPTASLEVRKNASLMRVAKWEGSVPTRGPQLL